jgi:hypothetical protein
MIKINKLIENELIKENKELGIYTSQGAVIGDSEFVIVIEANNIYLAHRSEFIFDGVFVKLRGE